MDGFHLPGDPYFPEGWNDGWNEDDLEPVAEVVAPIAEPEPEPMEEAEVENPRYPIQEMGDPSVPPGPQIYRHPGGPRWRRTARKRVRPARVQEPAPVEQPPQEVVPRWASDLIEEAQTLAARLQHTSEHHQRTVRMVETLQAEKESVQAENLMLREHLVILEQRAQDAERQTQLTQAALQELRNRHPSP